MPTYQYRCSTCGHEFEIRQSFSDAALTECEECGGPLNKVFGQVGIAFKGSGFYKTDSRSSSSTGGSSGSSSSSESSKSASTADASSSSSSSDGSSSSASTSSTSSSSTSGSGTD